MPKIKISPSILSANLNRLNEEIKEIEDYSDLLQVDAMDNIFVPNITPQAELLKKFNTKVPLDIHLMVKEPTNWVERSVRAGADRIIGQIEMMENQVNFVRKVSEVGLSVGLAIDLGTPVSSLDPTILTNLDVVLVMAVSAGFGGQKFDAKALDKVKQLDEIRVRDETPFTICVDGGETEDVIDETHFAGADEVAIGRRIFKGSITQNIKKFQKAAYRVK